MTGYPRQHLSERGELTNVSYYCISSRQHVDVGRVPPSGLHALAKPLGLAKVLARAWEVLSALGETRVRGTGKSCPAFGTEVSCESSMQQLVPPPHVVLLEAEQQLCEWKNLRRSLAGDRGVSEPGPPSEPFHKGNLLLLDIPRRDAVIRDAPPPVEISFNCFWLFLRVFLRKIILDRSP